MKMDISQWFDRIDTSDAKQIVEKACLDFDQQMTELARRVFAGVEPFFREYNYALVEIDESPWFAVCVKDEDGRVKDWRLNLVDVTERDLEFEDYFPIEWQKTPNHKFNTKASFDMLMRDRGFIFDALFIEVGVSGEYLGKWMSEYGVKKQ